MSERVMGRQRLEAFSDAVIAILITIMVLELHVPGHADVAALAPLVPVFLSYVLSFVYLGIYWNNHHHLLHAASSVTGGILWANLHLLFWLSLIPFTTAWMGENGFASAALALYGIVLLLAALAFLLLQHVIIASQGAQSTLRSEVGRDRKGKISVLAYGVAVASAYPLPWLAGGIYVGVALMWLVPDRRFERALRVQT